MTHPRSTLETLIQRWRDISSRPMRPTGFGICADELEAALLAVPPEGERPPLEQIVEHLKAYASEFPDDLGFIVKHLDDVPEGSAEWVAGAIGNIVRSRALLRDEVEHWLAAEGAQGWRAYVQHKADCESRLSTSELRGFCTCGLDKLLADPPAREETSMTERRACHKIAAKDRYMRRNYGVTLEWYQKQLASQGNKCAICLGELGVDKCKPRVDHHHESGQVREILCNQCNSGLGMFRESADALNAAIQYLRRHAACRQSA